MILLPNIRFTPRDQIIPNEKSLRRKFALWSNNLALLRLATTATGLQVEVGLCFYKDSVACMQIKRRAFILSIGARCACVCFMAVNSLQPVKHVKVHPAGNLLNFAILLFVLETHLKSSPTSPFPHTQALLMWCADEMKINIDKGVNISKCWLHRKSC